MAFDGKDDVIGIYGLAIVKLGPFAQVENPGLGIRLCLKALGQIGDGVALSVNFNQRIA